MRSVRRGCALGVRPASIPEAALRQPAPGGGGALRRRRKEGRPPACPPARLPLRRGGGGGRDVAAGAVRGAAGPGVGLPVPAGPSAAPLGTAAPPRLAAGGAAPGRLPREPHGGGLAGGHRPPGAGLGARRRRVGQGRVRGGHRGEKREREGRGASGRVPVGKPNALSLLKLQRG